MPIKSLPPNPSLEHLKYQARDLLDALSQGNAEAFARTREFHPRFARMSDDAIRASKLSLADAQLIIAREYGFESWPKLKHHIESSKPTAPSMIAPDFKPPAGPVELKWKWPVGARIVREMGVKQYKEIHTPGKPDPARYDVSMTTQYAYTVVKELPDAGREVDLQHLGFQLEVDSGAYLWRYDSAWKYAADGPIPEFKIMMDSKIRYFLNANSQIERMEGVNELVKRFYVRTSATLKPGMTWDNKELDKVIHRITSSARPRETLWLRDMFNEQYFKDRFDSSFVPARAVQPGDTWNVSRERLMHKGNPVIVDCKVTFQCWEMRGQHICARLEFRGTIKTPPQSEAAGMTFAATAGTFSGVTWFDPELSRAIETVCNQDFTVTWNRRANPHANPPVIEPIQINTSHYHQVITEKLISVN